MDKAHRTEAQFIRSLSSEEAATFLIEKYVDAWPVTISHRSWKKPDQYRLARNFLQGRVFASERGYKDFLSFMSVDAFLRIVEDGLADIEPDRLSLLAYYLLPCLRKIAKTEKQVARVDEFAHLLSALRS